MPLFRRNVCNRGSPQTCRLIQLAVFLSALFLSASAFAATYYVATTGSDSNPGTQAAPWKTFQKAANTVAGGDTVYFHAGAYAAPLIKNLNPPAGQWITFSPAQGEKATINTSYNASPQGSLFITDSSYLIFDGFEITNMSYSYNLPACNIKIPSSCPSPTIAVGIDVRSSGEFPTKTHHLIFRNNDIHNNGHGVMGGAADVQLLNNRIHNNGYPTVGHEGYGTYIEGERWLVRGNDIYQNTGDNLRLANTTKPEQYAVNWIIEQNVIHDQLGPFLHPNGVERTPTPSPGLNVALYGMDGGIFRNNIVFGGYGDGVWSRNMTSNPTLIYNNTIYGNGYYGLLLSGNSIAKNNIIYKNAQTERTSELIITGHSSASNNIVGGNQLLIYIEDAGKESGNFRNADPLFVNPAGGDFHLQSGSAAIDKGVTLAEVPGDYFGGARPFGAAYDIGAIEQGSTPGTVAPAPPPVSIGGTPPDGAPVFYAPDGSVCPSGYSSR